MGMRIGEGLDVDRLRRIYPEWRKDKQIANLAELGFVTCADNRLRATPRGRLVLNAVIRDLMLDAAE